MRPHYLRSLSNGGVRTLLRERGVSTDELVYVLVAENSRQDVPELLASLRDAGYRLLGGVYPAIIYGIRVETEGALVMTHDGVVGTVLEPLATGPSQRTRELLEEGDAASVVLIVDGLAADASAFVDRLFDEYGSTLCYLGTGAGSGALDGEACVFTEEGFAGEAAAVALLTRPLAMGVRHGWEPLLGPLVATRVDRNVILELNWQPALDVYRTTLEEDAGPLPTHRQLLDSSRSYPFGIHTDARENIVRDPLRTTDEGGLVCAGAVPENAVLHVLKGTPESLVRASAAAVKEAFANVGDEPVNHVFIADCVSRWKYLGDRYADVLSAIQELCAERDIVPVGVLSVGEICSPSGGFLQILNRTTVVGILHGR